MNEILLKDLITLLSINRVNGQLRKSQSFGITLLAGAICDLIVRNILFIDNGRIVISQGVTNDEVLTDLSTRLTKYSGKKLSRFFSNTKDKLGGMIRKQMKHLESSGLISIRHVTFMGINTGRRYRLIKPDRLNPYIRSCDTFLIYGRRPGPKQAAIIALIQIMGLLPVYYTEREYRQRAKRRATDIFKHDIADDKLNLGKAVKLIRRILKQNTTGT